jgi:hypothetical protein
MGLSIFPRVQTDWQNTSCGQTAPHIAAMGFAPRTNSAAVPKFPLLIERMNRGTGMEAGQAF